MSYLLTKETYSKEEVLALIQKEIEMCAWVARTYQCTNIPVPENIEGRIALWKLEKDPLERLRSVF